LIFNEAKRFLSRDKAKTVVVPLTQLGLLQITRQRINQNIAEKVSETCPTCKGSGKITSAAMTLNDLEMWIKNFKSDSKEFRLLVRVHPSLANELMQGTITKLSKLMFKYFLRIKLLQDESIPLNQFRVFSVKTQKEITKEYLNNG
jgi:ribonuclease G